MLSDLLWEVSAYAELLGEAALADLPISTASSGMLMTVCAEPGITVAEMSRRKPRSQQAISQTVARLEKLGLIERRLKPGRGVGLHLTGEGQGMAGQALERERSADERLREILGEKNHDALRALLIESRDLLRPTRCANVREPVNPPTARVAPARAAPERNSRRVAPIGGVGRRCVFMVISSVAVARCGSRSAARYSSISSGPSARPRASRLVRRYMGRQSRSRCRSHMRSARSIASRSGRVRATASPSSRP